MYKTKTYNRFITFWLFSECAQSLWRVWPKFFFFSQSVPRVQLVEVIVCKIQIPGWEKFLSFSSTTKQKIDLKMPLLVQLQSKRMFSKFSFSFSAPSLLIAQSAASTGDSSAGTTKTSLCSASPVTFMVSICTPAGTKWVGWGKSKGSEAHNGAHADRDPHRRQADYQLCWVANHPEPGCQHWPHLQNRPSQEPMSLQLDVWLRFPGGPWDFCWTINHNVTQWSQHCYSIAVQARVLERLWYWNEVRSRARFVNSEVRDEN